MTWRDDASLRGELNTITPRLRRYARALTSGQSASSELADDLVHATLMRALGARHVGALSDLSIRLYATVTQLNREMALSSLQARAAGAGRPTLIATGRNFSAVRQTKLSTGLLSLPLEAREALLLVGLEGFDYAEAARILRISRGVLISRLTQARIALDSSLRAGPFATEEATSRNAVSGHGSSAGPNLSAKQAPRDQQASVAPAQRRSRVPYLRLVT